MHHLIAMFYALVFSFSHPAPVQTAEIPLALQAANSTAYPPAPNQFARFQTASSYPETACVSCRQMTTVSYRVR